ncbi:MAG: FecR domain-containing protein [Bacteroidales bacterium]|nr:FecR domain-containing protein [Bacteroidales bacterium]
MKCNKVEYFLPAYIMGELGELVDESIVVDQIEAHLCTCNKCAEEYKAYKQTIGFVQDNRDPFADVFAELDRKEAEKAQIRRQKWARILAIDTAKPQIPQVLARIAAVAASIAIAFAILFTVCNKNSHNEQGGSKIVSSVPFVKIEKLSDNGIIPAGQEISTDSGQMATLVINSKHRMILNENTSLSISPLEEGGNVGCLISLNYGRIYTQVEHDGNPFIVETDQGKAIITGTIFDISATGISTIIVVNEGTVQFGSDAGFVNVTTGQISRIIAQSVPTLPILCNTAKLTAWATDDKTKPVLVQATSTISFSNTPTSKTSLTAEEDVITFNEDIEGIKTTAELIEQAKKYDAAYTLGTNVNRQKALNLYNSALESEPDEKQRLHILYRMAQLYGMTYQKNKGEKPNYSKAIELYEEIIDSYPPDEPNVIKAMLWTGGHQTTLWDFESAIGSFKKALKYNTNEIQERIESLQENGQEEDVSLLKEKLDVIKHYQEIAVDNVDSAASHISYARAHGELRNLINQYQGTFIADRAHDRFVENMDKMPELWEPKDDIPISPSGSTLQPDTSVSAAHTESQKNKDIKTQADTLYETTKEHFTFEPNITEITQEGKHIARKPRAPPLSYLSKSIVGAACLIVLGLAAILIRKQ